jgi:tRNA A37 threonylcarbamoyladenosine dehydratase
VGILIFPGLPSPVHTPHAYAHFSFSFFSCCILSQIRVWGLDAQKRIRGAQILVVGLGSLAVEVCKNLLLAGVGGITIVDTHQVEEAYVNVNHASIVRCCGVLNSDT